MRPPLFYLRQPELSVTFLFVASRNRVSAVRWLAGFMGKRYSWNYIIMEGIRCHEVLIDSTMIQIHRQGGAIKGATEYGISRAGIRTKLHLAISMNGLVVAGLTRGMWMTEMRLLSKWKGASDNRHRWIGAMTVTHLDGVWRYAMKSPAWTFWRLSWLPSLKSYFANSA